MACQIKELAEYILANHDETSSVWKQVNAVINADKNIVINSSQVEFNKLPNYKEGQKTMTYAGIGSRETPKEVLELMTKAAAWLEGKGYKLQTGKTFYNKEEGADKAFSDGTKNKELFGPESATETTKTIAKELHPAPQYLKEGGLKLMARNTNQVFGKNLDTPVDFVLFYAEETNNPLRPKGGTGQAVEMARRKGIPTINMADVDWRKQLTAVLNSGKSGVDTQAVKESSTPNTKVNIDSNQQGLEYALTNPTHTSPKGYSWTKGDKPTRDMLAKGIDYKGKHYADVEQAFQTLKDKNESKTKPTKDNSNNYKLMVDLITTKLQAYPRLVKGINDKGGLEYLNSIVHQPTNANSVWETGGQDWFKSALIDAYNRIKFHEPEIGIISIEDVEELFSSNKEVANTIYSTMSGTTPKSTIHKLYATYLNNVFPSSKFKGIVYHYTNSKRFEKFDKQRVGESLKRTGINAGDSELGFFFGTKELEGIANKEKLGTTQIPALLNITNPNTDIYDKAEKYLYSTDRFIDEYSAEPSVDLIEVGEDESGNPIFERKVVPTTKKSGMAFDREWYNSYKGELISKGVDGVVTDSIKIVFEPEQIHIMGSKEDSSKFKKFIDSTFPKYGKEETAQEQTESQVGIAKDMTKTLNYKDIEELLETYGNDRETVIGDDVGYVGEHDTKYTINHKNKIRTVDGEVWDAIGLDGRDIAVLKNAITQLNKYRVHSQLTEPQQRVLKVMTDLTHEQLAEIIENSEYAAGASLGYSNIQNQKVGVGINGKFDKKLAKKIEVILRKLYPEIRLEYTEQEILHGQIKGQADIEAKTVLINSLLQSQDTLPHEYAHHYIRWFKDTPIVQEAIKKWGHNPYKGKIIIANSGTGKSVASSKLDNVIDGDTLLVTAANQLLKREGTGKQIQTPSQLNDAWVALGKNENTDMYKSLREEVYVIQAKLAKEASSKGNTVLLASARTPLIDVADMVMFKGDTNALQNARKDPTRENILDMTIDEIAAKNKKFLNAVKGKEVIHLNRDEFILDKLIINGEEALVQAIGEQVVEQKGEVYGWWKKFSQWIQGRFNKLSDKSKEELRNILTDAFLTKQDLYSFVRTNAEKDRAKVDIIQPSEVFTKNINKLMKC